MLAILSLRISEVGTCRLIAICMFCLNPNPNLSNRVRIEGGDEVPLLGERSWPPEQ